MLDHMGLWRYRIGSHNIRVAKSYGFGRGDEFFRNDLFDCFVESTAGASMLERAHARVEQMVAEFASPVPGTVQEQLKRYFRDLYTKAD